MTQQILDLHVNPSDETIRIGLLTVRFLITGDNSSGNIATTPPALGLRNRQRTQSRKNITVAPPVKHRAVGTRRPSKKVWALSGVRP